MRIAVARGEAAGDVTQPRAAQDSRAGRRSRREMGEWLTFLAFVLPNLFFIGLFSYWPLIQNVYISFVEWDMISPDKEWVGLDNWKLVLSDRDFSTILGNTFIFTLGSVAGTLALGLLIALLLNQPLGLRNAARAILFTPTILPGAAIAVVWIYMFDPKFGLVQALLGVLRLASPNWLSDPSWAMTAVIIVYIWKNVGYSVVIFLAGLQGIPRELYEAARVDGAGAWQRFRHVTVPGLGPISFFLLVTSILGSFQAFDIIRIMTSGGPINVTTTLVYQLYQEGFVAFHPGRAAVYSLILFAFMLTVTLVQLRFVERRVTYGQ